MNWFTHKWLKDANSEFVKEGDVCEHLEENPNQATKVTDEKDSFGVVGRYSRCSVCLEEEEQREEEEEHICSDCNKTSQLKDGVMWTTYDHYPPQGDEPMFVCDTCRFQPKHIERLRKDRADMEWELGNDDDDFEE